MKQHLCVIDCGTNTFNILICEIKEGNYSIVHESKVPVKIGKGIPLTGKFSEESMERAIMAMQSHKVTIESVAPGIPVIAVATAAFRNASNRDEMIRRIQNITGITVRVISGEHEAELIAMGIKNLGILSREPSLIMDIGGGSTELILCDREKIWASRSFDTGASKLLDQFSPSDPIRKTEIADIEKYLEDLMGGFLSGLPVPHPPIMIGSSGFFDSVADMCFFHFPGEYPQKPAFTDIQPEHFDELYRKLLGTIMEERMRFPGLAQFRAEMIVVSYILARFVYLRCQPARLVSARYSMKEGILYAWLNEKEKWENVLKPTFDNLSGK